MDEALEAHLLHQADGATQFFWHRLRWKLVRDHLPTTPATLLDVGAGIGAIGELLATERPDITYTFDEPIDSLAAHLAARFGAERDLRGRTSCPDVDIVTLLDVIEHIDDDEAFLSELVARLSPGTTIVITVPGSMRLWSQWDVSLGHRRRYEKPELEALVGRVPVQVLELGRLFPEMVPAALWRARRQPPTGAPAAPDQAEFPDLPRFVDEALYQLGRPGVRWRRHAPIGTSLYAALRVR